MYVEVIRGVMDYYLAVIRAARREIAPVSEAINIANRCLLSCHVLNTSLTLVFRGLSPLAKPHDMKKH